jgi:pimeloyl-[acyl-carrier protein] methyl ester esterase
MSLHVDEFGNGAPLLLIHGWGMHGGLWGGVAERLAHHFRVFAVDLPGHGHSAGIGEQTSVGWAQPTHHLNFSARVGCAHPTPVSSLDAIVDELSAQFSEPLTVCGWSLGGQVALRWAMRQPQQVNRLVLVASTPCFVQRSDWPCAMAAETLAEFDAALRQNYAQTLRRFLALQLRGGEQERELLAVLRDTLFSRGEPDLSALQQGLAILRSCDLRSALPFITQPALIVAGGRDALAPLQASQYMAQQMPVAELVSIEGAAHAPFLSHADEFVKHMVRFLHG